MSILASQCFAACAVSTSNGWWDENQPRPTGQTVRHSCGQTVHLRHLLLKINHGGVNQQIPTMTSGCSGWWSNTAARMEWIHQAGHISRTKAWLFLEMTPCSLPKERKRTCQPFEVRYIYIIYSPKARQERSLSVDLTCISCSTEQGGFKVESFCWMEISGDLG